ncbi:hypothetical protein PsorP6_000517 [Peronosclerospora sorghi]|uniref:Uncharacterized protein n=1 Tax=Peronosclerospora sorghi TaxID=230839 RepID=A0ACC0WQR7_9STRA|nr:hypothetical protein PsorP6_000517 [Peronosclerospora sorghi]
MMQIDTLCPTTTGRIHIQHLTGSYRGSRISRDFRRCHPRSRQRCRRGGRDACAIRASFRTVLSVSSPLNDADALVGVSLVYVVACRRRRKDPFASSDAFTARKA